MPRTALIVAVPEAEAVVGELRLRARPVGAALGVPAHITILFPFLAPPEVDEDALAELIAVHAFDFELAAVETSPTAHASSHPTPRAVRRADAAVWQRWPDHPPYEGALDEVIPHLTVPAPIELEIRVPIRRARATR